MDRTEIIVNGEWKIVRIDSCNWQVFNKREIGKSNNRGGKSRAGEVDWVGLPAFFSSPDVAACYVYNHMGDRAGRKELREFVELMESARDEIIAAFASAEAGNA